MSSARTPRDGTRGLCDDYPPEAPRFHPGGYCRATLTFAAAVLLVVAAAPGREIHVSPSGRDTAAGTREKPFRTIARAAEAVNPGDTCIIHTGVYRETVRLKRSGEKGRPIRFIAAPGARPVISGTEPIAGKWTRHKGSIYRTTLSGPVSQVFVDGRLMTAARWPNMPFERRWDKTAWAAAGAGSELGKMADPHLGKTGVNFTGATATMNIGSWQTYRRAVGRHAAGAESFTYEMPTTKAGHLKHKRRWAGFDHYFITGPLAALDSAGEWYADADNTLYLWMPDGRDPTGRNVEVKVRGYGFVAKGVSHVELSGLHFAGTTLKFERATSCVIDGVHMTYPTSVKWPFGPRGATAGPDAAEMPTDWPAVRFFGSTSVVTPTYVGGQGNVVRNSSIRYSHGPAITLVGTKNVIDNCLMHDIDWFGLDYGFGVDMLGSTHSTIRRCTVFNIGGSEGVRLSNRGVSIVEYNHLHHGGLAQSDGAMVQSATANIAGTTIRYNWVHDHNAFNWGGSGIRGDDGTRGLLVHHNVAWRCSEKGIVVKGDANRVYNNTCLGNARRDILLPRGRLPGKVRELEAQNVNSRTLNNCGQDISGRYWHERAGDPPAGEVASNYSGAKPMLADVAYYDFRPGAGSPLIDAGQVIKGITDGHQSRAPDVGAYEYGGERWIPGCRNGVVVSAIARVLGAEPTVLVALRMPPTEKTQLVVRLGGRFVTEARPIRLITFSPDTWHVPQAVVVMGASLSLVFENKHLGKVSITPGAKDQSVWFDRAMLDTAPIEFLPKVVKKKPPRR